MLTSTRFRQIYKVTFALAALTAVVTEFITLYIRGELVLINFFSFFTFESNIFAAIILILSARSVGNQSSRLLMLRGAAVLYMTITGIMFAILLSGSPEPTAVPWVNLMLHYIMPVVVLLDWFIDPPRHRLFFRPALIWLVYPLSYLIYSLIRGAFTNWYPYEFLSPAVNGVGGILMVCTQVIILALIATSLLVLVSRYTSKAAL